MTTFTDDLVGQICKKGNIINPVKNIVRYFLRFVHSEPIEFINYEILKKMISHLNLPVLRCEYSGKNTTMDFVRFFTEEEKFDIAELCAIKYSISGNKIIHIIAKFCVKGNEEFILHQSFEHGFLSFDCVHPKILIDERKENPGFFIEPKFINLMTINILGYILEYVAYSKKNKYDFRLLSKDNMKRSAEDGKFSTKIMEYYSSDGGLSNFVYFTVATVYVKLSNNISFPYN